MTSAQPPRRPARPTITLQVLRREQLSPHLVRIVLTGDAFDQLESNAATDKYVKISFTDTDGLPVTRTYTVRNVDAEARTLSIDFVVHGDEGLAGPWADGAKPGDELTFAGPGGGYTPDPAADWHLFAGDQSALPAIASALEALPDTATGLALIQAADQGEVIPLTAPAGVHVGWVFGTDPALLVEAVAAAEWLEGRPQIFAHGERSAMKSLRDVFNERGVQRSELSLSGYWALGRTEDKFQAEKWEPVGQIEPVAG